MQERVYIVQTPVHDTSTSLSLTHGPAYHKVIDKVVGQWRKRLRASMRQKDITLNICQIKTCSFQSQHSTQLAVFRATNSLPRKNLVSHYFHRSYLKENKVSKSEGKRKLNKHIIFESVLMLLTKSYQN